MSEAKCYLCAKPGSFDKLFKNCKHDSACQNCLYDRYVTQAQHVSAFPLECFHPDCHLAVCNTQMKRLVRSEAELETFYRLEKEQQYLTRVPKMKAKVPNIQKRLDFIKRKKQASIAVAEKEARWGKDWREIDESSVGDVFFFLTRCYNCKMLIVKDGGCNRMTCVCGSSVDFVKELEQQKDRMKQAAKQVEESFEPLEQECMHKIQLYNGDLILHKRAWKHRCRHSQLPSTNKKKRTPLVVIDEEDEYNVQEYSTLEHDDVDESPADILDQDYENDDDYVITSDLDSMSLPSSFSLLEVASVDGTLESSSSSRLGWEHDFDRVLELASDDASNDSWSLLVNLQTQSSYCNDSAAASWEEVSQVSSVVSIPSREAAGTTPGMSFLEAARAGAFAPNPQHERVQKIPNSKKVAPKTKDAHGIETDYTNLEYDGTKGARGGKAKFRYGNEQRLEKKRGNARSMNPKALV